MDAIGYYSSYIYNWVVLLRIGPKPSLISAIGILGSRYSGTQRVGPTVFYWNSHLNLRRSTLV